MIGSNSDEDPDSRSCSCKQLSLQLNEQLLVPATPESRSSASDFTLDVKQGIVAADRSRLQYERQRKDPGSIKGRQKTHAYTECRSERGAQISHTRQGIPVRTIADVFDIALPIIVWGTTVLTERKLSESEVQINTVRQKVDFATLPNSARLLGMELCTQLFGDRFVEREGLLAIVLSNLNPQNHLGIAMMNLTRMEKGETLGQGANVTPAVGHFIEALDAERLAIAESFGLSVRTVREHFALSFNVPQARVSEMNQQLHEEGRGGFGPKNRQPLCPRRRAIRPGATVLLGQLSGRPAVLHAEETRIFSASYGVDFAGTNDLLPQLAIDRLSPEELKTLCKHGYAA